MKIERIGKSRIRSSYTSSGLEIEIPSRLNIFVFLFLSVWLSAWTAGGVLAISALFSTKDGEGVNLFLLFWLCGWALGWLYVASSVLWQMFGREKLFVNSGVLTRQLSVILPFRTKSYEVAHIGNPELLDNTPNMFPFSHGKQSPYGNASLAIDYGPKTMKFGLGMDRAEAREVMNILKKHMPSVFKRRASE